MKKFLLIVGWALLVQVAYAQDVIVKVNGDELKVKVLEINLTAILYQLPDSAQLQNTANVNVQSIAKADVFMVRFANGTREVFQENLPVTVDSATIARNPDEMYLLGQQDARQYYTGNGAMWGSAASTLLAGPVGPLVIGVIKPKAKHNMVSDVSYLQDPHYVKGYEKQAHKKKAGKAALGLGIGSVALMTWLVISLTSINHM